MSGGGQGRDGRQEPPRAAGCRQQVGRAARSGRRCRAVPVPFPLPPAPVLTTCGGGQSPPGPGQRPVHCGRSPPEVRGRRGRACGRREGGLPPPASPSPPSPSSSSSPPSPARPAPPAPLAPLPAWLSRGGPGPGSPALVRRLLCHPCQCVSLSPPQG